MAHTVFSFFSGCGLLDLGFDQVGFDIAYVSDNHPAYLKAHSHISNTMLIPPPTYGVHCESITDVDHIQLANHLKAERRVGNTVGFVGGPPCPDFSVGGKNAGHQGKAGNLCQIYVELIAKHKPDWFVLENVKGLVQTKKHRVFYMDMLDTLAAAGYHLSQGMHNAIEYGVAQDRDRVIIFGSLSPLTTLDWQQHKVCDVAILKHPHWPTRNPVDQDSALPQALPRSLTINHWFDKNDVPHHPNAHHHFQPRAGLAKMQSLEEGDVRFKSYKRLHRNRYSPTAAYGNNEVHIHPWLSRRLSVAEVLAVQGAPKEVSLPCDLSLTDMFKTVGNAVPFPMAYGIASTIRQYLDR